eukprot:1216364-Pyramimonas_sp.AAC.2
MLTNPRVPRVTGRACDVGHERLSESADVSGSAEALTRGWLVQLRVSLAVSHLLAALTIMSGAMTT